jgi:hypothetical protein
VAGQRFDDPVAGVTLTTESANVSGAAVTVRFGTPSSGSSATVSTDKPSYSLGQTVSVIATVTSDGAPVSSASVTFAVTKSTGGVVTGTATTARDGISVYKLRLRQQDPVGTYQVLAVAGQSHATTTFIVE